MEKWISYLAYTAGVLKENIWGDSYHWIALLAFFIFMIFVGRKKYPAGHLLFYPLLAFLILACPIWGLFVEKVPDYEEYYIRLYTIMPWIVFLAFGGVVLLGALKKPFVRMAGFGAMVVLLVVTGSFVYSNPQKGTVGYLGGSPSYRLVQRENWWKIPSDAMDAGYLILEDAPKGARVLAKYQVGAYLRQYSSKIELTISGAQAYRESWGGWAHLFRTDEPDVEAITDLAEQTETKYLVFKNISEEVEEEFLSAGWEVLSYTGTKRYVVYKLG